ncbi:hypothetical protein [Haemophilus parahaemolyticus]|uniref:hypothetical protein n=1 Tax=Haemophilus parahaemolyticus TaxID=735 RepID=UPI0028E3695C|nr:hypothetical protein [Haemophilus parahaemolyticus]
MKFRLTGCDIIFIFITTTVFIACFLLVKCFLLTSSVTWWLQFIVLALLTSLITVIHYLFELVVKRYGGNYRSDILRSYFVLWTLIGFSLSTFGFNEMQTFGFTFPQGNDYAILLYFLYKGLFGAIVCIQMPYLVELSIKKLK